jgi:acylphosphatase
MSQTKATATISGRVQGVAFRHFTKQSADQQGVNGWVRNNMDGTVEATFEGEESAVRAVINWCRQGPDMARVDSVHIVWHEASEEFDSFSVLP